MQVNKEYVKNNLLELLKEYSSKSRILKNTKHDDLEYSIFNDLSTTINSNICNRVIDELCDLEKYPIKTPYLLTEKITFTIRKYLGVYGRQFSYEQIAQELGINKESVKSKILRFVEKLAFQYTCHKDNIKEENIKLKILNESKNELVELSNVHRILIDKISIIISQLYNNDMINELSNEKKKKIYKGKII